MKFPPYISSFLLFSPMFSVNVEPYDFLLLVFAWCPFQNTHVIFATQPCNMVWSNSAMEFQTVGNYAYLDLWIWSYHQNHFLVSFFSLWWWGEGGCSFPNASSGIMMSTSLPFRGVRIPPHHVSDSYQIQVPI